MATTPRNRFDAGALADARGGVVRRPAAVAAPPLRWPLLPLPDADGVLQWPSIERCVADAIRIVLATRPGEQLQQPRFGVGLEDELAAPNTVARRAAILARIKGALAEHEPRIEPVALDVTAADDGRALRVEIRYRLAGQAAVQRLTVGVRGHPAALVN